MIEKIRKSDEEWRHQLTSEQYQVCRRHRTERPFSGKYDTCKEQGTYVCSCCGHLLFDSSTKFDSGTGWPSFFLPINDEAVETQTDRRLFMTRTEVHCARCDAHLGHVFDDGPQPSGLRYCMNSVSLDLRPKDGPGNG